MTVRLSRRLGFFQAAHGDVSSFDTLNESIAAANALGDEVQIALATDSMGRAQFHWARAGEAAGLHQGFDVIAHEYGHGISNRYSRCTPPVVQ